MNIKNILCILGNSECRFDRLVNLASSLSVKLNVISEVQAGANEYEGANIKCVQYFDRSTFVSKVSRADLILSHCGSGTLRQILFCQRPAIIIPRLKCFDEHIDDHQKEIATYFHNESHCLLPNNYADHKIDENKVYLELKSFKFRYDLRNGQDLRIEIHKLLDQYCGY